MSRSALKVLMVMEQCNPEWASVPLVAYNFYSHIRDLADVTLVTHERNRSALEKVRKGHAIEYIPESSFIKKSYSLASRLSTTGGMNWPLHHALSYPVYFSFNRQVFDRYADSVRGGYFDVVHVMTPVIPRYPSSLVRACRKTPFVLGPVNGGVPFPAGFAGIARKEFGYLNFLRAFTRLIPGYVSTYRRADRVLAGSCYTRDLLQKMFGLQDERLVLFHENGVQKEFIGSPERVFSGRLELLFVGRLVPYKGADMALEAISSLDAERRMKTHLTIVGDGPELGGLKNLSASLGIDSSVTFTGWIDHAATAAYYRGADVFFFPSVREFGGAVALEAMAAGLPCIVPDYAGLGEYVTDETGFKIAPTSREYLVGEMAKTLDAIHDDPSILAEKSKNAAGLVREYEWGRKAERMVGIYRDVIAEK